MAIRDAGVDRCGGGRVAAAVGDVHDATHASPLGGRPMVAHGVVDVAGRAVRVVDRVVAVCARRDGRRESAPLSHGLDRGRCAARHRGREALFRRSLAGRWRRADRVVHRRRPAAARRRLPGAGAAAPRKPRHEGKPAHAWIAHRDGRRDMVVGAVVVSAQAPSDFAMRQPLLASGDKAFFRIELPDAVYDGAARSDLGDLRVFNGDGALVPFAFMPRPSPLVEGVGRRPLALFPVSVDTTRSESWAISRSGCARTRPARRSTSARATARRWPGRRPWAT